MFSFLLGITSFISLQLLICYFIFKQVRKQRILPPIPPEILAQFESISRRILKHDFSSSLPTLDKYTIKESCIFINAILVRIYCKHINKFDEFLKKKIDLELDDFNFKLINYSYEIPYISDISSVSKNNSTLLLFHIKTKFELDISNSFIDINVKMDKFESDTFLRYLTRYIGFGFISIDTDLKVSLKFNGLDAPRWMNVAIEWLILKWIQYRLIVPNARIIQQRKRAEEAVDEREGAVAEETEADARTRSDSEASKTAKKKILPQAMEVLRRLKRKKEEPVDSVETSPVLPERPKSDLILTSVEIPEKLDVIRPKAASFQEESLQQIETRRVSRSVDGSIDEFLLSPEIPPKYPEKPPSLPERDDSVEIPEVPPKYPETPPPLPERDEVVENKTQ